MARATGTALAIRHDGTNERVGATGFTVRRSQGAVDVTGADTSGEASYVAAGVDRFSFDANEIFDSGTHGQPPATGAIASTAFRLLGGGGTGTNFTAGAGGAIITDVTVSVNMEQAITTSYSGVFNGNPTIS